MKGIWIDMQDPKALTMTVVGDDGKAATQSDKNETVVATLPMGLMEQLFLVGKGRASEIPPQPGGPSDQPQGQREVRQQFTLSNGAHFDMVADASRKVADVSGTGDSAIHVKATKDGALRLQVAGNSVVGSAKVGTGDRDSPKWMPGGPQGAGQELNSFDVSTPPLKAGEHATVSLNITGGDPKFEFVVIQL